MKVLSRIAVLILLCAASLPAQQRALKGVIVDQLSGLPVARAELRFSQGEQTAYTRADGSFHLSPPVLPGTLLVRRIGYRPMQIDLAELPSAALTIHLTPAPTQLTDLVATAGPVERSAAEMVLPVTRVDREELNVVAPASADRILAQLPGLQQLPHPPSSSTIMIRGISDNRVLVLLDGEPAPGQLMENRDLSRLSTIATDRIEVVKGPLSAQYGSQAIGGTVNLISRAPEGPFALEFNTRAGSFGRKEGALTAQAGGGIAWRLTGGWRSQDRLPGQPEALGMEHVVWDGQGTLRSRLGDVGVRLDASISEERQRWPLGQGFYGFNDSRSIATWTEASMNANGGTLRLRLSGEHFTSRYREAQNPVPYRGSGVPAQRESSGRLRLIQSLSPGAHHLDLGLEASLRGVESPQRMTGDQLSDRMLELWAEEGYGWHSVYLTAAGRMSWNSRWGNALTPSLGLAIEPIPAVRLRSGAARGFRAPSFKELGWQMLNPTAGYTIEGNPDLRPESSWQVFVGATWVPVDNLSFDLDLYRNTLSEMIEQNLTGFNPAGLAVYSPRNVAHARTQGVEVALRWSGEMQSLSLGYDRLSARNLVTGDPLSQRSPHTARLRGTRYLGDNQRIRLDLTGRLTSSAPLIDDGGKLVRYQQGWVGWDLAVQVNLGRLDFDFGVDNLFDTRPDGWEIAVRRAFRIGVRGATRR